MKQEDFHWTNSEILITLITDPLDTSKDLSDLLEAKIIKLGEEASKKFEVGDRILVRRDNARELKSPFFAKDTRVIYNEKSITCKFPK